MTDDFAIEGAEVGYVPCFELPATLVVEEEGAISGLGTGRVARGRSAASLPAPQREAIVGSGVGFVAKPCVEPTSECGCLAGSSGLVDAGTAITGTHTVVQSSAPTLEDAFGRTIPYVAVPTTPGPDGLWYQYGLADSGQQWWHLWSPGTQLPPPPNSIALDGNTAVLTVEKTGGTQTAARINWPSAGGYDYEHYDFGWRLADHGFDATVDVFFSAFGAGITDINQFTLSVQLASPNQGSFPMASVTYRTRRSTDDTQLFMVRGASGTLTFTKAPLIANTWYRIRWQVDGPMCASRVRIWRVGDGEPTTWDGETTLFHPMAPNAAFGPSASTSGAGPIPRDLRIDNVSLSPVNLYGHATVCEDDVTQLGPRQYQLRNSYLPRTITAFVEHAGYPLVMASRFQGAENIIEDDPVAGIFSFPASISYSPAYNPTITTGTTVTACYIVPPPCAGYELVYDHTNTGVWALYDEDGDPDTYVWTGPTANNNIAYNGPKDASGTQAGPNARYRLFVFWNLTQVGETTTTAVLGGFEIIAIDTSFTRIPVAYDLYYSLEWGQDNPPVIVGDVPQGGTLLYSGISSMVTGTLTPEFDIDLDGSNTFGYYVVATPVYTVPGQSVQWTNGPVGTAPPYFTVQYVY